MARTSRPNAADVTEAQHRIERHPRSLRRVMDAPLYDMVIFEDRATGERRHVPNKLILNLGQAVAFELSGQSDGEPDGS